MQALYCSNAHCAVTAHTIRFRISLCCVRCVAAFVSVATVTIALSIAHEVYDKSALSSMRLIRARLRAHGRGHNVQLNANISQTACIIPRNKPKICKTNPYAISLPRVLRVMQHADGSSIGGDAFASHHHRGFRSSASLERTVIAICAHCCAAYGPTIITRALEIAYCTCSTL